MREIVFFLCEKNEGDTVRSDGVRKLWVRRREVWKL